MMTLFMAFSLGCNTGKLEVTVETGDTGAPVDSHDTACIPTAEVCDGVDDDCDGLIDDADPDRTGATTWHADADADGYGNPASTDIACAQPTGFVADGTDCDDTQAGVNPGVVEVCNNIDDDCDALIDGQDDSLSGVSTWYMDLDGDRYGDPSNTQAACNQPTGSVTNSADCDDTRANVNPGEPEVCDGLDNDCDGLIDGQDDSVSGRPIWYTDLDRDGYGDPSTADAKCEQPAGTVADDTDCDDGNPAIHPGAAEVCNDVDDDCDTLIDGQDDSISGQPTWYADGDGDGYGDSSSTDTRCNPLTGYVASSTDCDDTNSSLNPGAAEVCNDVDDDCDTLIDGQDDSISGQPTWYADGDGDGYGDSSSAETRCNQPTGYVDNHADCDDTDATIGPCSTTDDGSVCAARWGVDDGQVPTYTGTCDTTAGFSSFGGHCYYAVNTSISNWDDARTTCAMAGGSLAVVTDTAETDYVYSIAGRTYAGGCDDDVEGTWTWVNGEPWSYEAWSPGEPNDSSGTEECLELAASGSGGWNDIWCTFNSYGQHYVCEFE